MVVEAVARLDPICSETLTVTVPRLACQVRQWRQLAGQRVVCPWAKKHHQHRQGAEVQAVGFGYSEDSGEPVSGPKADDDQSRMHQMGCLAQVLSSFPEKGSQIGGHETSPWRLVEVGKTECWKALATGDVQSAMELWPTKACWRYGSRQCTDWLVSGSLEESKEEEEEVSLVYIYQPTPLEASSADIMK